jgi:hypothetical protein
VVAVPVGTCAGNSARLAELEKLTGSTRVAAATRWRASAP